MQLTPMQVIYVVFFDGSMRSTSPDVEQGKNKHPKVGALG